MSPFWPNQNLTVFYFDFWENENIFNMKVATTTGESQPGAFLCVFFGTEHFYSKLPYNSKKKYPYQKYGLVKCKLTQPEIA